MVLYDMDTLLLLDCLIQLCWIHIYTHTYADMFSHVLCYAIWILCTCCIILFSSIGPESLWKVLYMVLNWNFLRTNLHWCLSLLVVISLLLHAACHRGGRGIEHVVIYCLFHAGLSFRTTEESLRKAFQNFGELVDGENHKCSHAALH